jgi:hypothetical protein
MIHRKCPFCRDSDVALADTELDGVDHVRIILCCSSCDRSFVEVYEYSWTEDEVGDEVDDE